jgi:Ca2+-binding RTX toxin-like protein
VAREPARRNVGRLARAAPAVLLLLALAPPATAARPRCLGEVATITGSFAGDELTGTSGRDVIVGLGGNDLIDGVGGNDLLCGGRGNDALFGNAGRDRVDGGGGGDQSSGGAGDDAVRGGPGFDYVNYYLSPTAVQVDLAGGTARGEGTDGLEGIESVFGSQHADTITGNDGSNYIQPFGGADTVEGRGALDIVFDGVGPLASGTDGDDSFDGGEGLDAAAYSASPASVDASLTTETATGNGTDEIEGMEGLWGSAFDDVLTGDAARNLLLPGGGDDNVDGRGANDAVAFWFATGPVTADLSTGSATGEGDDTLVGLEGLLGSVLFDDVLRGNDQTNLLDGDGGDDRLFGDDGNDWLVGGLGEDQIDGGPGSFDLADFSTTAFQEVEAPVTADLADGSATGHGADALVGIEALLGSELDDTLRGDDGPNVILGLGGNDLVSAADGDDRVDGGPGRDEVDAGAGDDRCRGAEIVEGCEGSAEPPAHPAAEDAKIVEDFRRNFRRNF